jgi:RNA polymerase sigma factor (sigma-70 family)
MDKDTFKYDIVRESSVEKYEELPEHFLADTIEEAEQLYKEFYALLNNLSYSYSLYTKIDKSDLFGEALIGLARASRDFDPKRSNKFKIFAIYKIKSALNEYVRRNMSAVVIPAYIKRANKHIGLLRNLFEACNMPENTLYKIIEEDVDCNVMPSAWLNDQVRDLLEKLKNNAKNSRIPIQKLVERAGYIPTDVIYDEWLTPEEAATEERNKLHITLFIDNIKQYMNKREQDIVERILNGQNNRQIGDYYKITGVRVGQILKAIGKRLQKEGITLEI